MPLQVEVALEYQLNDQAHCLLQIEAADTPDQSVSASKLNLHGAQLLSRGAAEDAIGQRFWIAPENTLNCTYSTRVEINRPVLDWRQFGETAPEGLPPETVRYLLPSRYCPAEVFVNFVNSEFAGLSGGARIGAIVDWIAEHFTYAPGTSTAQTNAEHSFVERQGVCRDYAHVLIALARACTIPARFASVYAPDTTPPDFHAVAEVFLHGSWHLIDATGMAKPDEMVRIGVGPDATSTAFLTIFGAAELVNQSVSVTRV